MLHGREAERAVIDQLLLQAGAGRSGAVVVRGEAGIGKSALLNYAENAATDMRILRGVGVETEAGLAFAGLHLLLGSFADRLTALPPLQAAALRGMFGLTDARPAERFMVGLATLSLLSELAEDRPLLCVIDDAQWLDQASADALLFASRRLDAEGIAMIFAVRDGVPFSAPGLRDLRLHGLSGTASAALLAEHSAGLAPHVRDQILDEAQGNPLALLELPGALTPAQRAGELPVEAFQMGGQQLSGRLEEQFAQRVRALPAGSRLLVLIAAAEESGGLDVVLAAGEFLGIGLDDLEPVEVSGLIGFVDGRLTFRHPLVRSAAYREATVTRRLAVHRALANVHGARGDLDRRTWHLSAAALGPDEDLATDLERIAEEASVRGGHTAVSVAYQRAAKLTADPERRAERLARAAEAAADAGQTQLATALDEQTVASTSRPGALARLARMRITIAQEQEHGAQAVELAQVAGRIAEEAPGEAAFLFLNAVASVWSEGDLPAITDLAARTSAQSADPLLAGVTAAIAQLADDDTAPLLGLADTVKGDLERGPRERLILHSWLLWVADVEAAHDDAVAIVRDCRAQGAIGVLPKALLYLGRAQLILGRYRDVAVTASEGLQIAQDTARTHYGRHLAGLLACLAAIQGDEARCDELTDDILRHGITESGTECLDARDLLDLSVGRYDDILKRVQWSAEEASGSLFAMNRTYAHHASYVEAAVRAGQPDLAAEPCARLAAWARMAEQPWITAIALRCQALLAEGEAAERLFAQAVQLHGLSVVPFEQARTELLYGEHLRRGRRRAESRPHFRAALDIFLRLGATLWAERASSELRATGETPPAREQTLDLLAQLTPQELQVVRLAAAGMSNRDIAAQMFLSPRTVSHHLYKAYPKLGVASRHELARMDLR
ncbi:AAA ATPase domain-containing protein [Nonomuraea solani]|uniref:AAA ATPase domain-containing protein n=1 Tax=Nonomuraea solani TaxID=1144553 RepID=A0A1H6EE23_9ACTN|nr:helix-turn-helix transcriptional regulator [Nonomuraea solani]SEG95239.1 AAA ATPase domain-containing protein [Nonomuraea solani]